MAIEAVIFDMNGVIVDDEPVHELAFKEVCKKYGIILTSKDYSNLCLGRTDKECFLNIIEESNVKDVNVNRFVNNLVNLKSRKYLELIQKHIKAFPHAIQLIKQLKHNFRLALTSSSSRDEISMILTHFKINGFFEIIVSAQDVTNGKPNPEPYLLTAKKLEVKPKNCLVIEDSKNGVESAKSAGMYCIGIHNPLISQDLSKANIEVDSLKEISVKIIKSL